MSDSGGRGTWVEGADRSGFGPGHLPYGVFSVGGRALRIGVRIGQQVLDLAGLAEAGRLPPECGAASLGPLMVAGRDRWAEVRGALQEWLVDEAHRSVIEPLLTGVENVNLHLPFEVADYVDFYSSEHHARNVGRLFRPDDEPLLPNWKHMPVGYHGRAGTVVVSGTPIVRPHGQYLGPGGPAFGPTARLDLELEVGFVVGVASEFGVPVPIDAAGDHLFGLSLVNDWSARDLQAWEYRPLGPFLGKSFATSVAGWVTPIAALEPFRLDGPPQDPEPLPYLRRTAPWGFDLDLEVWLSSEAMRRKGMAPVRVAATGFAGMYWTVAQQLAHLTVNGASIRTGDLLGSGTVSGAEFGSFGSLLELTGNGKRPIELPDGTSRTFLEDGDEVTLRGSAGGRITLGEVTGHIVAPRPVG